MTLNTWRVENLSSVDTMLNEIVFSNCVTRAGLQHPLNTDVDRELNNLLIDVEDNITLVKVK